MLILLRPARRPRNRNTRAKRACERSEPVKRRSMCELRRPSQTNRTLAVRAWNVPRTCLSDMFTRVSDGRVPTDHERAGGRSDSARGRSIVVPKRPRHARSSRGQVLLTFCHDPRQGFPGCGKRWPRHARTRVRLPGCSVSHASLATSASRLRGGCADFLLTGIAVLDLTRASTRQARVGLSGPLPLALRPEVLALRGSIFFELQIVQRNDAL
ncbi:hypothetical protein C8Q77DRAFT_1133520 [Trametes polyzona]|nr:hypothetical protein C8Q77DRAFT_1133520 [Trametes polyzona]